MSEEAKKRVLERYSKATILEAYLMLSEKYSFVAGKTVADVFNENLLAAPDIPEEHVTDDLCKAQAYQDYMGELKDEERQDARVVFGDVFVTIYNGKRDES